MGRTRRTRLVIAVASLVVVAAVGGGIVAITSGPHLTPAQIAAEQEAARIHRQFVAEQSAATAATKLISAHLPTKGAQRAPVAAAPLFRAPLAAHHVVGFVPYWEVSSITPADIADASDLVYSEVCPTASGAIDAGSDGDECSLGLAGLESSGVASLVTEAHADGDRVLLSVETTDDALIEQIDAHSATVAPALAANLVALERLRGFDGTNIDFEGTKFTDRESYVRFASALTAALRRDDPTGEILIDTYAAGASGPRNFFDPKRLAPLADALFVEAYSLQSNDHASAGSPLVTRDLGYSAVQTLLEYEKLVPADKIILGLPFYGYSFATANGTPGSSASALASKTYFQIVLATPPIVDAATPALWDRVTETPYARYERAGQWHQVWFEDPTSIALKVALAANLHTAGVGAWAFGMEGGSPLMLAALTGGRPPLRTSLAR